MLLAALAFVVIASCFDGDTCTTTSGERVRLACINSPELRGKSSELVRAKVARDHLKGLIVGKEVWIRRITEDRYERTVAELFVGERNVQREMVAAGHAEVYQRYAHQCPWTEDEWEEERHQSHEACQGLKHCKHWVATGFWGSITTGFYDS